MPFPVTAARKNSLVDWPRGCHTNVRGVGNPLATSTGVAEVCGFVLGCEGLGELADQRVETDAVLQELLDEPDVVQAFQSPPKG